jgi:hypothetical protein
MSLNVDEVKFLRSKYLELGQGITIYGDNMILSSDGSTGSQDAGSFIIWDDEHLVYHSIKPNRHPYYKNQQKTPLTVQSSNYDQLQFFNASITEDQLNIFLDGLITDGVLDADRKEAIIQSYRDIKVL